MNLDPERGDKGNKVDGGDRDDRKQKDEKKKKEKKEKKENCCRRTGGEIEGSIRGPHGPEKLNRLSLNETFLSPMCFPIQSDNAFR